VSFSAWGTRPTEFLAIPNMSSPALIDAQFDRAVGIVQGLPKTGPIQTDYEEKLTMYRFALSIVSLNFHSETSCYQFIQAGCAQHSKICRSCTQFTFVVATVGNVTTPRPGIWDMLGRAKWLAVAFRGGFVTLNLEF